MAGRKSTKKTPDKIAGEKDAEGKSRPPASAEVIDPGLPVVIPPGVEWVDFVSKAPQPVTIEVVFKQAVRPEDLKLAVASPPDVQLPENAGLTSSGLIDICQRHHLQGIEPSFRSLQNVEHKEQDWTDIAMKYDRENFIRLHFPEGEDVIQILQELKGLLEVEDAVPVPKAVPPTRPQDEPFVGTQAPADDEETQWYIFRCRTDSVWDKGFSGKDVVIADIDFGFCTDHEELQSRIELKHNSVDGTDKIGQGNAKTHGTAVLGLAAASVNGKGIAGFAHGASLWAIQANFGAEQPPLKGDPWVNAIDFVRETDSGGRRKVIILERQTDKCGNIEMVPSIRKAIQDAIASNIVVCVPAGNGCKPVAVSDFGEDIPETGSILVGATKYGPDPSRNEPAEFSNFGRRVAVSAPGDLEKDITCSCLNDPPYGNKFGGTSGAAAKVAGAVALMLEANSELFPAQVKEILINEGRRVVAVRSRSIGSFLDVEAAVAEAIRRKNPGPQP